MNTKILYAVIAVVILAVSGYFLMRGSGGGLMMSEKSSMKALLASTKAQECEFNDESGDTKTEGTVRVAGGRMRGDFSTTASGKTTMSHMILKDNIAYIWTDEAPQGFKMPMSDIEKPAQENQSVDVNKEIDYSCSGWSASTATFDLPANVTFSDIGAMMNANMQGNMNMGSNTTDAKALQCGACDQAPEPQRTQCRQALQC